MLDFLGLTSEADEAAVEEAMTLSMSQTLMEFGAGMAFAGRQVHLEAGGDDFYIDLLLYHIPTDRYVVVGLKADPQASLKQLYRIFIIGAFGWSAVDVGVGQGHGLQHLFRAKPTAAWPPP